MRVIVAVCLALAFGACMLAWSPARVPAPRIGGPAPDFSLQDLDGKTHRLSDYKGRVVVLEWTSHLCPAVKGWYEAGRITQTIERVGGDAVWLAIDSSFFAGSVTPGIRAWRADRGIGTPCLLDPGGVVGGAYGASCTPQFFVIDPTGTLVYKGELSDWRPRREGSGRNEHLIDAVKAAKEGRKPAKSESRAEGCSVKYWDPAWGERTAALEAREMFDWATGYAAENMTPGAFELLRGALAAGYPGPSEVLAEPRWRFLRNQSESRRTIAGILREFARESSIAMVDKVEKGERLVVSVMLRDAAGKPVEGALVHIYHTDERGLYNESGEGGNPRLFAFAKSGADGRIEYRTIRPGHYPMGPNDDPSEVVDQHVHYEISCAGFRDRNYGLGFRDDPVWKRIGKEPPAYAAEVMRGKDGVDRCEHEIVLERR